jgi:2-oxoglutarate/2-oxoacid ferredoxin oxidoreductase subunit beta
MNPIKIPTIKNNILPEKTNLKELRTQAEVTWCPGCPDFSIMEAARRTFSKLIKEKWVKKEDIAITAGVGCHAKIFDYLNVSGLYGLHGRAIPTALGIKIGNPNLKVMIFAGDGDTYSEGLAHFIQAGRYNADMTLCVHENQSFSLTTGQATPTSQLGFKTKAEPMGEQNTPLNPIELALSAGASFVARTDARDFTHTAEVMEQSLKHSGFAFIEIIQDCIIYNLDVNNREKRMYMLPNKKRTWQEAMILAREFDYNLGKGKIPIGIFFQERRKTLDEEWPQLAELKKKKMNWKQYKAKYGK